MLEAKNILSDCVIFFFRIKNAQNPKKLALV